MKLAGKEKLPPGKATLRYEFAYDGGGLGKGGAAKIFVNDKLAAAGRIEATVPFAFTAYETLDMGLDTTPPEQIPMKGPSPLRGKWSR